MGSSKRSRPKNAEMIWIGWRQKGRTKTNERSCAILVLGLQGKGFLGGCDGEEEGKLRTDVSGRGRGLITHLPRCAPVTLHGGMDASCMVGHSSTLQRCDWKYNWPPWGPRKQNGWTDRAFSRLVWLGLA